MSIKIFCTLVVVVMIAHALNVIIKIQKSSMMAAAIHEEKSYNNLSWGEVPYTEDDVNDELSLMGTYL